MKFGIFDHLDRRDEPLARIYDDRIRLVERADALGIASYHLAEHHWNPVGMAPEPGVFLAALAKRTTRIRLGPLAYAVTFHNPLILAEEICMLDHLSGGRINLGVGRGISVWELGMFGYTQPETRDLFHEAMEIMLEAFTADVVNHRGRRWQYYGVPMELKPLQKPYPPLWYGSSSGGSRDYVAGLGMAMVAGWSPNAVIRRSVDAYRESWERMKDSPHRAHAAAQPTVGSVRHIVIADTDAEAETLARAAYTRWADNLEHQAEAHGFRHTFLAVGYETARRASCVIAGTPKSVRDELHRHVAESGVNYVLLQLAFGSLTHEQEVRTLELFAAEVMPHFAARDRVAAKIGDAAQ
jgi:alkanesulfonate monooxygenase SsuD/methylene tetrahydromethanopterin reductase-like flavin-dependent oxidoreductase (luciferase family)